MAATPAFTVIRSIGGLAGSTQNCLPFNAATSSV